MSSRLEKAFGGGRCCRSAARRPVRRVGRSASILPVVPSLPWRRSPAARGHSQARRGAAVKVLHDDDWGDHEPPPPIPRIVPVILLALAFWVLAYWALA